MKVILIKDTKDGKTNQIIEVSDGYGKNYLIRNKFAVICNDHNLKELAKRKKLLADEYQQSYQEALLLKDEIEKLILSFSLVVTNDVIHGSITTKKVNQALIKEGIKLKKHILQDIHIHSLGITKIKIELFENVIAILKIRVEKE